MLKRLLATLGLGFAGYVAYRTIQINNEVSVSREITDLQDSGILTKVAYGIGDDIGGLMGKVNEFMGLSFKGMAFIKGYEAFRANPYYATQVERQKGILTIGYGYTYKITDSKQVERFENGISKADAEALFIERVAQDEKAIRSGVKVPLTQGQFDALVSLRYNVGSLAGTRLIEKLNSGDYDGASNEFMSWVYQDGEVLNGLYKRRAAEVNIFKFNNYVTSFG